MFKDLKLENIYQNPQQQRYNKICQEFKKRYGTDPDFITRAPGRVNLIGQHIDYEGYGVLPFAIEKDCVIAVGLADTKTVEIKHIQQNEYIDHIISSDVKQFPKFTNVYVRYFYAGYQAALRQIDYFNDLPQQIFDNLKKQCYKGLKILIQGNVPKGSGLSSSSSFCVCSALATLKANGLQNYIKKQNLIQQIIKYERLVGTAIGGMDQSISILGQNGSALFIQFQPISSTVVKLPDNYKFVITNSLQQSKKIQTLGERYNKRVCQCFMAVSLLSRSLNIPQNISQTYSTFRGIQQYCKLPIQDMSTLVQTFLIDKQYTIQQLEKIFGSLSNFLKSIPNFDIVIKTPQTYNLYKAAKHVYSQAYRVKQFVQVCKSQLPNQTKGIILGKLMNQSQQSCRDIYKCSSNKLNILTSLAIQEGAVGSRLTGAGWGGCAVSMVQQSKVKDFINAIKSKYYDLPEFTEQVKQQGIDNLIFQTSPAEGASFVSFK